MTGGSELAIGVGASALAALMLSSGTLLQALDARGVDAEHGLRLSLLTRLLRRPRWVAGTIIGYCAFPFQLIALAHAPLVIVQPIHALGLLGLLVAGAVLLGDPVTRSERLGAATLVIGLVLATWGAPRGPDPPVSRDWFAVAVALLLLASLIPYAIRDRCGRLVLLVGAALGFTAANLAVKGISDAMSVHHWGVAVGYLVAAAVASTSGVLGQMTGFQRHRAIEVVPVTYAIPIFLPALLGVGLLRQDWAQTVGGGALFAGGALLLVAGTSAVIRSQSVLDIAHRVVE
jgi:drug/metabolite transporter (DMT)-like permease